MDGIAYVPGTVAVDAGDVVRWVNLDDVPHDVMVDTGDCQTDVILNGGVVKLQFLVPGSYGYLCTIHPWMIGTVVVN